MTTHAPICTSRASSSFTMLLFPEDTFGGGSWFRYRARAGARPVRVSAILADGGSAAPRGWKGPGGPRRLQNGCLAAGAVTGGFDSHAPPPRFDISWSNQAGAPYTSTNSRQSERLLAVASERHSIAPSMTVEAVPDTATFSDTSVRWTSVTRTATPSLQSGQCRMPSLAGPIRPRSCLHVAASVVMKDRPLVSLT